MKRGIRYHIVKMLRENLIRRSNSSFATNAFLVPKGNGSGDTRQWRFVADMRPINSISAYYAYNRLCPRVDDVLNKMGQCTHFTVLDIDSAYHLLGVKPEHCHRLAFVCFLGTFEYQVAPMGYQGSGGCWIELIDRVLKGLDFVVHFIDDLCIFSKSEVFIADY